MSTSRFNLIALVLAMSSVGLMQSSKTLAMSCPNTSKEVVEERSESHKDLVQIEITKDNVGYFVEAFFPSVVGGRDLVGVSLTKGTPTDAHSLEDRDFLMHLKVTEQEDGLIYSSFRLKAKFTKDIYVRASYGGGCSFGIEYLIDFSKSVGT